MRVAGNQNNPINMKCNKSIILAALALAGLMASATIVRADDPPPTTPPPPAADDKTPAPRLTPAQRQAQMIKDLGLTGDKADKFKALQKEQQEKIAELRKDTTVTGADRRTKMKEITDATTAKMKDVLDKDQFVKWQKMVQQQMPGRRGARGGAGAGGTPPPAAPDAPKQP
jgi:protein CpxP